MHWALDHPGGLALCCVKACGEGVGLQSWGLLGALMGPSQPRGGVLRGRKLAWTRISGRGLVRPIHLQHKEPFHGGLHRVEMQRAGVSPQGWREGWGGGPHSTSVLTDADQGGANSSLTRAPWALRGSLFQLGDDLRQGLQVPFTLHGRDQEVKLRLEGQDGHLVGVCWGGFPGGSHPPLGLTLTLSQTEVPFSHSRFYLGVLAWESP